MKNLIMYAAVLFTALICGCGSGDDSKEMQLDSANTLHDTFPANGLKDSLAIDSQPRDKTHVDSLDKLP